MIGNSKEFEADPLINLALDVKGDEKFIYLMFFNSGYFDFVRSWMCNIKLVDSRVLKRTLFVAGDTRASELLLESYPEAKVYTPENLHYAEGATYGTYEYFKLTLDRLTIQSILIQSGINVFVIEADAVWFSAISEYMLEPLETYSIISADDGGEGLISAGFLYFDQQLSSFFEEYTNQYRDTLETLRQTNVSRIDSVDKGEQHMMTKLLTESDISVFWLDECHFARGQWYDDPGYRLLCPHPKVIQNNYLAGNEQKIARAKKWGHWFVNNDGTCLSHLPGINPLGNYDRGCEASFRSTNRVAHPLRRSTLPSSIMQIANLADHFFVIGSNRKSCNELEVNWALSRKLTCVCVDELNRCLVPDREVRKTLTRPQMISNSHGYVHLYSKRRGYRHIAVMEEGLVFREPADLEISLKSVKTLLHSDAWTLLRFGRRPHFLEGLTLFDYCPPSCICELDDDMESLCRLRGAGCDLRSQEFYMSSERSFLKIAERLNDDTHFPLQGGNTLVSKRRPELDIDVFPSFPDQWLMLPVLSIKKQLELDEAFGRNLDEHHSIEHQLELHNTYQRLCLVQRNDT